MTDSMKKGRFGDWLFFNVTRGFAAITLAMLVGIVLSLAWSALPSITHFGFGFLTSAEWNPPAERFGAVVPMYGTLVTSAIALIIARPQIKMLAPM